MGERLKEAIDHNYWFWVLMVTAIALIVAAFIVPPTAVIDGSVLAAVGELAGFGAIGTVIKAMDKGVDARVRHRDTEVTVGDLDRQHRHNRFEPVEEPVEMMEGEEDE